MTYRKDGKCDMWGKRCVCEREFLSKEKKSKKNTSGDMYGKNGKCETWGKMACVCKDCLSRKEYVRCHIEKCAKWESVTCGTRCARDFLGGFFELNF